MVTQPPPKKHTQNSANKLHAWFCPRVQEWPVSWVPLFQLQPSCLSWCVSVSHTWSVKPSHACVATFSLRCLTLEASSRSSEGKQITRETVREEGGEYWVWSDHEGKTSALFRSPCVRMETRSASFLFLPSFYVFSRMDSTPLKI